MELLKFFGVMFGVTCASVFISAIIGVVTMRTWEAEDEDEYFTLKLAALSMAWLISCIINGGFAAYLIA